MFRVESIEVNGVAYDCYYFEVGRDYSNSKLIVVNLDTSETISCDYVTFKEKFKIKDVLFCELLNTAFGFHTVIRRFSKIHLMCINSIELSKKIATRVDFMDNIFHVSFSNILIVDSKHGSLLKDTKDYTLLDVILSGQVEIVDDTITIIVAQCDKFYECTFTIKDKILFTKCLLMRSNHG